MPHQSHRWTIDSIVDHVATVEVDGHHNVRLPAWVLPRGAREGDILAVRHDMDAAGELSSLHITRDHAATTAALQYSRQQVERMHQDSRKRDPGGNIKL